MFKFFVLCIADACVILGIAVVTCWAGCNKAIFYFTLEITSITYYYYPEINAFERCSQFAFFLRGVAVGELSY